MKASYFEHFRVQNNLKIKLFLHEMACHIDDGVFYFIKEDFPVQHFHTKG